MSFNVVYDCFFLPKIGLYIEIAKSTTCFPLMISASSMIIYYICLILFQTPYFIKLRDIISVRRKEYFPKYEQCFRITLIAKSSLFWRY